MFRRNLSERPVTFDVVGIEVFGLASPEKAALPADGAIAETLELFADEFKSLFPCRCLYVRRHHSSMDILDKCKNIYNTINSIAPKLWPLLILRYESLYECQ